MPNIPRHITTRLKQALKVSPVVFLNGPRQAGKTTLVQSLAAEMEAGGTPVQYVSFDRPTQMAAAAATPEAFLRTRGLPLIIDEVQMVPELFRALKIVVDEARQNPQVEANGQYILTGSANILALPQLSDPLVGRMSVITLLPFSAAEAGNGIGNGLERMFALDFSGLRDTGLSLLDAISLGTFPEVSGKSYQERSIWFDGYITTLLQRDVRQLAELERAYLLPQLLRLIASRAGSLVNYSDLSRDIGLNAVTGKLYRHILEMMFLHFDVKPWFRNIGKRLVKAPKSYLLDSFLLCHMLDLDLAGFPFNKPELFGHIVENYVASELKKLLGLSSVKAELYHFRTSDGKEIDFVLERPDGSVLAIEVKNRERITLADFKQIQVFEQLTKPDFKGGIILYAGKEVVPFGPGLWAVPFAVLWQ